MNERKMPTSLIIKLMCVALSLCIVSVVPAQKTIYRIDAEMVAGKSLVKVKIETELQAREYLEGDSLSILLLQNAFKNKQSDFHKTWLSARGPDFYFYKPNELKGFHNLKFMVEGKEAGIYYTDPSEIMAKIRVALPPDTEKVLLQTEYDLLFSDDHGIIHLYDWYPVVLNKEEVKIWEKGKFTAYTSLPEYKIKYNLSVRVPSEYEIIINQSGPKKEIQGKILMAEVTGSSDDICIVLVPDKKQIKQGNIKYFGENTAFSLVTLGTKEYNIDLIESDLQKIFGYYMTYVGRYPYDHLYLFERDEKTPILLTGNNYLELLPPSQSGPDYLVRQTGKIWLKDRVLSEDFIENWYSEALVEFLAEKYFRDNPSDDKPDVSRPFVPSEIYEPTDSWLDNYYFNYQRKNTALGDDNSGEGLCFQHQYKVTAAAQFMAYMELITGEGTFAKTLKSFLEEYKNTKSDFMSLAAYFDRKTGSNYSFTARLLEKEKLRVDYSIQEAAYSDGSLKVKMMNKGVHAIDFPLLISNTDGREIVVNVSGFTDSKTVSVPLVFSKDSLKLVSIDPYGMTADQNRENNHYFFEGNKPKSVPLKIRFSGVNNSFTRDLYLNPLLLYNDNNQLMPAIMISNTLGTMRHFRWSLVPVYSFSTKKWVGQARMTYDIVKDDGWIERIRLGGSFKSFDFNRNKTLNYSQRYIKADPSVGLVFKNNFPSCNTLSILRYRYIFLREQYPEFMDGKFEKLSPSNLGIHRLEYKRSGGSVLAPYSISSNLEYQTYKGGFTDENQHYLKLTASFEQNLRYDANKFFNFRLFGSAFIANSQRNVNSFANNLVRGTIALIHQGFNDYLYDEYFASRQNQGGSFSNQVSLENGGGFKTPVGSAYSIGMSNDMAFSANFSADLPVRLPQWLPLQAYFDFGLYSVPTADGMKMRNMWNGGLMVNMDNYISIHFPLVYSNELRNIVRTEKGKFLNRISFTINMNKLAPNNLPENRI
jgi:hypothetical protein